MSLPLAPTADRPDADLAADLAPAFEVVPARCAVDAVVAPAAVRDPLRAAL
ncbi:MAG: hypothetical protein FJ100_09465, partial [Deltaproteobacteria bacterium]|nr:hypothetical protein [Deltaproteobacteria bacterium]